MSDNENGTIKPSGCEEIFVMVGPHPERLRTKFSSEVLRNAGSDLGSIALENSAVAPTGLWVKISVPSCKDDVNSLAKRLKTVLWTASIGMVGP